jgi:hypothetical protein
MGAAYTSGGQSGRRHDRGFDVMPGGFVPVATHPTREATMRRLILGCALAGLLALILPGAAMAQAGNTADTLMNVDFSVKSKKAGTKKKGRPVSLTIKVEQSTRTGVGQPATSRQLKIGLPKEFRWNGKLFPSSKRCDPTAATRAKSTNVCPKGSKVGSGHVTAIASGGNLVEELDVSVFVTTSADLGLFLDSAPTAPTSIKTMLVGSVSGGRNVAINIPTQIQEPLPGVPSAIRELRTTINGTVTRKGKKRGVIESFGCNRAWTLSFTNVFLQGSLKDSDFARCTK